MKATREHAVTACDKANSIRIVQFSGEVVDVALLDWILQVYRISAEFRFRYTRSGLCGTV